MKAHLAKLSLALLSTVFLFGCQDMGSEPLGPGPGFDKPGSVCAAHCHDDDAVDPEQAMLTLADGMDATAFPVDVSKDTRKTLKVSNHNFEKPTITMHFTELAIDQCEGVVGTNGGTVPEPGEDVFNALLAQLTATVTNGKVIMNIDKTDLMVDGNTQSGRHQVLVQYDDPVANPIDLGLVRISVGSVLDGVAAATVAWTQPAAGLDVFEFTGPVVVWDAGGGINDQSVIQCPGQTVLVTLNR